MELLLWVGSFFIWAIIKILATAAFAVPTGFGLAAGFNLFKKWRGRNYLNSLDAQQMAGAAI